MTNYLTKQTNEMNQTDVMDLGPAKEAFLASLGEGHRDTERNRETQPETNKLWSRNR
jgi:hypothetical protein